MGTLSLIEALSDTRSFQTRHGSRVAIIGSGILGTTLALRYSQAGRLVTLFESTERSERRGHSSIASSDRGLSALLGELELTGSIRWGSSPVFGARFGVLDGGRARIIDSLRDRARSLNVDVRLGTPVREIYSDGSGFAVRTVSDTGEFDEVVVTVPSPVASKLVPALPQSERAGLTDTGYFGIINVSFVLEKPIGERYITRVQRGRDQFTLLDPAALVPSRDQSTTVYVTRPLGSDNRLFRTEDREIIEHFARALPGNARIITARVTRLSHAFAHRPAPSFTSSIRGLSIVNAAHMGSGRHHLERTAALATTVFRALCSEPVS